MTEAQSSEETSANGAQSYSKEKAADIVKQVEYYFGDINLPRDKFLLNEMKTNNGWIPLTTMLKFNRLAKISEDINELANALQVSDLIEVNQENDSIRRSIEHPLPDNTLEYWLEVKRRTVYVKGFPQDSNIDEILTYMHQHGNVLNVLMRKTKSGDPRIFKGSIFATFATAEEAEKFANNPETITYKERPLIKFMQEAYWANKAKEAKEKKQALKSLKEAKKSQVSKEQKEGINAAHFVKGIVLKVQGLPQDCTVNEVRDYFRQFGDVAYVKFGKENEDSFVRFNSTEENAAQTSWDKAAGEDGKATFEHNDTKYELTAQLLDGEEESAYWVDFNNQILRANRPSLFNKKRGNKRHAPSSDDAKPMKKSRRIVFNDENSEEDQTATVAVDNDANGKTIEDSNAHPAN